MIIVNRKVIKPIFRSYVLENFDKIKTMTFEEVEDKILKMHGDRDKEMESVILMIYLLTFNSMTKYWDYYDHDVFADLIDAWEYLRDQGLKNYWGWKIYDV